MGIFGLRHVQGKRLPAALGADVTFLRDSLAAEAEAAGSLQGSEGKG